MNPREKRIRILNLQDQHCHTCEYRTGSHVYCMEQCKIGKEMRQLGKELVPDNEKKRKLKASDQWDERCRQAVEMKQAGYNDVKIAEKMGYHLKTLREQLKKRGLFIIKYEKGEWGYGGMRQGVYQHGAGYQRTSSE
ncbi:zinc-finger domain-containing protein [Bacillus cereus]